MWELLTRTHDLRGVALTRTVERRAKWPRAFRRVRASAVPGVPWPHTTPWEWHVVRAHHGQRLVGFALLRVFFEGDVDFHDLAVHADHQHRGYGGAICDEAVSWMRELEYTEMSVVPTSSESHSVFVRAGFRPGPLSGALVLQLR